MILTDILKKCLSYINESTSDNGGEVGFVNSELAKSLKECANTCYGVIFSSYSRMVAVEDIRPTNGYIPYTSFEKRINRIISLKKDGFKVPFKITERGLKVDSGDCLEAEYTYFPDELDFDTEVILADGISPFCFAYMIVSEYWLREGDWEKSGAFYEKFLASKQNYSRTENKSLKVQRWL